MIVDGRMMNVLTSIYRGNNRNSDNYHYSKYANYENNDVFNKLLEVKLDSHIDVPIFILPQFEYIVGRVISRLIDNGADTGNFVFPVQVGTHENFKRTFDTVFSFFNTARDPLLLKVTTNKGEVYYGNRGIIFDKDFNLLMMITLEGDNIRDTSNYYPLYKYNRTTLHLDSKVFEDQSGLVNKNIIKKLIPYYSSNSVEVRKIGVYMFEDIRSPSEVTARVKIHENLNSMLKQPVRPSSSFNDDIRNLLQANVERVKDQFELIE